MRWLLDALKAFILLFKDYAIAYPWAARGGFSIVLLMTIAITGLMAINPERYWWAPYVLVVTGFVLLLLLVVGILALGEEMAGGSGAMGGRTGVMLRDLDAPPLAEPRKRNKLPVRRKGDAVPGWKVKPKGEAAQALLNFLAQTDAAFGRAELVKWIEDTAVRVREAIENADLRSVDSRLTADGRHEIEACLDALAAENARQMYGIVTPTDVRIVVVSAPADSARHSVTALITLKSRDYVMDATTDELRDGNDDEIVVAQEFWSFRRDGMIWQLDRVRPGAEADEVLDELNELSTHHYAEFQKSAPRVILDQVKAVDG